ncbi:MAG: hypothetical protein ACI90U_002253 [Pseudomonadales bacterium]|jgi:hypothetical protein
MGSSNFPRGNIDFPPSSFSLRKAQAEYFYDKNDLSERDSAQYTFAGAAVDGGWFLRAADNLHDEIRLDEWFWIRQYDYQQLLIGKNPTGIHPLVPNIEVSGASYIFSSEKFDLDSTDDISRSSFARESGSSVRDIIGEGSAGDIAQLVINGAIISRVRVRLDGVYEFLDVELPSRGYNDIQIRLFDRGSLTLTDTHDYSVSSNSVVENVGEFTVYASGGKQGNVLDERQDSKPDAGMVSVRYGLFEDFTVEAGFQDNGNIDYQLFGINSSFAKNWFGAVSVSESSFSGKGYQVELSGVGDGWKFDLLSNDYEDLYFSESSSNAWNRRANYRQIINDSWTSGFVAVDDYNGSGRERFILPSVWYYLDSVLSIGAVPNNTGSYRIDGSVFAFEKDRFTFNYEDDFYRAEYVHSLTPNTEFYLESSYTPNFAARHEAGGRWYFDGYNQVNELRAGIVGLNNGKFGYNIDWRTQLYPGVTSSLRLDDEPSGNARADTNVGLQIQWELSLNFSFVQGSIVPASRSFGSASSGSVSGELLVGGKSIGNIENLDRISISLNGRTRDVDLANAYFFIDSIAPGIYDVRLDGEYLPIQYTPDERIYKMEVKRGAVTSFSLNVSESYSVAGRAVTVGGFRFVGQKVTIFDETGNNVSRVVTDQFGLYRVNSLVPGTYQFVLEFVDDSGNNRKVSKEVVVTNEFLFGQDIVVQDGAGEEISLVKPTVLKVIVINDNFEAVDTTAVVAGDVNEAPVLP